MKFSPIKLGLLSSVCLSSLAITTPTIAQDNDDAVLEEIVVTARRREESLQDAPVAITAFSARDIDLNGLGDITELAQSTPNLVLEPSRATNSTLTAFIRGVGQQDPLAGFEPGVAIYIDDVYLARPQGSLLEILDVERIEILRGPQGTLYGRNAMGGAIKYITKRLGDEPSFKANGRIGSYGQRDVIVSASGPVSDSFKLGAAFTKMDRNGFGTNINLDKDNYDKDLWGARITAELTPSEDVFFRVMADYTNDTSNAKHGHRLTVSGTTNSPVLDNVYDTRAGADENYVTSGIDGNNEITSKGISGALEWNLSENITLKSITAYREDLTHSIIDFDSLPGDQMDAAVIYANDQFTQEFQLLYSSDKINAVTGFYYINANAANDFDLSLGALGPLGTYTGGDFNTKSWSAFADVTYDIDDQWSISVGGRYTYDKRSATVRADLIMGLPSPALGGDAISLRVDGDFTSQRAFKAFTPRILINYKASDDMILYGTYSQGFKAGGFDPRAKNIATGVEAVTDGYKPETLNNFEAGMKSTWLDGRATTNVAVFASTLKDMQIAGSIPIPGVTGGWAGNVTNAGKASINGVEIETKIAVTENFLLSGSVAFVDANIDEWVVNGVDISDTKEMQNTPKHTANISARYTQELNNGSLIYTANWSNTGRSHQFETPQPAYDQKAYSLLNASVVWSDSDGNYTIGLHGKNLANKRYATSGYDFMSLIGLVPEGVLTAFYGAPRTVTLNLGVNF